MNTQPTVLFLTTELPYPADSGGRIKSFRLLEHLSKQYRVKLLCAFGSNRPDDVKGLKETLDLETIQVFDNHQKRTGLNFLKALMYHPTFNAFRIYSDELANMVKWTCESTDLVIVDHLEAIHLMPEDFKGKMIYHSHNAEFKLWEHFAQNQSSFLVKSLMNLEAKRVKKLEKYTISRSIFSFVAPNDQKEIQAHIGFKDNAFRLTYHLGNDALLNANTIDLQRNAKQVFYAGTLSWEPNRDGMAWFITSCWPTIRKKEPSAELRVCGSGADASLTHLMRMTDGVTYLGFVDDLEKEMSQASVAVVPLRFGSGMKIKTFDALYRGIPLVSTSFGAEGLEIASGKHAFIEDDASAFSECVLTLLADKPLASEMSTSGRAFMTEKYTYAKLFESMTNDLNEALM